MIMVLTTESGGFSDTMSQTYRPVITGSCSVPASLPSWMKFAEPKPSSPHPTKSGSDRRRSSPAGIESALAASTTAAQSFSKPVAPSQSSPVIASSPQPSAVDYNKMSFMDFVIFPDSSPPASSYAKPNPVDCRESSSRDFSLSPKPSLPSPSPLQVNQPSAPEAFPLLRTGPVWPGDRILMIPRSKLIRSRSREIVLGP
jgi:hypothetical protein